MVRLIARNRALDHLRAANRRPVAGAGAGVEELLEMPAGADTAEGAMAAVGTGRALAALGGVAVAAGALPAPFGGGATRPVPTHSLAGGGHATSAAPGGTYSAASDQERPAGGTSRGVESPTPSATGRAGAVAAAELCRAYSAAHGEREKMNDGWYRQLRQAAGGRSAMYGYCAQLLGWDRKGSWTDPGTGAGTGTGTGTDSSDGKTPSPAYGSGEQAPGTGNGTSDGGAGTPGDSGPGDSKGSGDSGNGPGTGKGDGSGSGHGGAPQGN